MTMALRPETGPRGMDPHLNSKLTAATIKIYRLRAGRFMAFIIASKLHFRDASELDDLIVEFENSVNLSKSEFDGTIAAVEHVLPHCKGGLRWAHAVSKAWAVTATPSHTVPLCEGPCFLLACHMAARGHARLGVCFILQNALGLRPSEGLGLEFDDVLLPEDRGLAASAPTVVGLGGPYRNESKTSAGSDTIRSSQGRTAALAETELFTRRPPGGLHVRAI